MIFKVINLIFISLMSLCLSCSIFNEEKMIKESLSPNGMFFAYFTNKSCIDGPCHTLYVKDQKTEKLSKLMEIDDDTRWCSEIIWSPDSIEVAFLIMRKYLYIYNINDLKTYRIIDLIPGSEESGYPPNPAAYRVHFSPDGELIYFIKGQPNATEKELDLKKEIYSISYKVNEK